MEVNFYNAAQYYGSWAIIVASAIWISVEIYIWSKFMFGLRTLFFRTLIGLLLFYSVYNGSLILYGIIGVFYQTENFIINDFSWIGTQRMYSHAIFPLVIACIMRAVNYRSGRASPSERNIIYQAGTIIARSKKERARAEIAEAEWELHISN